MTDLEEGTYSSMVLRSSVGATSHFRFRGVQRRQLLEVACEIFADRGYHAASMEVIAQGVGISKPTLYKHFSSKLELYLAVLQIHLDILVAGVQAALRSTTDNAQRVHAAVQAYFDFTDQEDQGVRLVFASDLMVEPSVQWRVDRAFDACVQAVFDLLARDSGVDPRRVRVLAVGVVGASQLAARHWLESNRPIPKEVAVETTAALCWGGLSQIGRLGPMATAFGKVGHHAEPRATELD